VSLPHAILGLINYRPATGYDVKNTFKKSIHFFWNATLPQIYRTLRQMEADGWVTSVVEHQDGKPSRKIYHVTGSGQQEFARWLTQPPEAPEPRSSMLVKVFFGNREGGPSCRHRLFNADGLGRGCALLELYA
jgi:DNA-binding PadR family transcriptional regulator